MRKKIDLMTLKNDKSRESTSNRLRYYKLWTALGILNVIFVIYMSLTPSPPDIASFNQSDKIMHYATYAFLMCWFGQIFKKRTASLAIAFSLVILGIILEIFQGMGGFRTFEYYDIASNTVGVLFGLILCRIRYFSFLYFLERLLKRL